MIKPVPLFISSLLVMTCSQLYEWRQDPSITGLRAQVREPEIRQPVERVAIPVDTLVSSGDYWRLRHGCLTDGLRYRGYSVHDNQRIAVVLSGGQERIYRLGDNVTGQKSARIISLDDRHVVLRYPDNLAVLCRDEPKKSATTVSPTPANLPLPNSVMKTALGNVAIVRDDVGQVLGYRLQQCERYCWLMRQFSLQEGDTITSVQGVRVTQMTASELKNLLVQGKQDIALTLQRGKETKQVSLPWRSIAPLIEFMKKEAV